MHVVSDHGGRTCKFARHNAPIGEQARGVHALIARLEVEARGAQGFVPTGEKFVEMAVAYFRFRKEGPEAGGLAAGVFHGGADGGDDGFAGDTCIFLV